MSDFGGEVDDSSDINDDNESDESEPPQALTVADNVALQLDDEGQASVDIGPIPPTPTLAPAPANITRELTLQAAYADPDGEIQTLGSSQTLWSAAVVAGIKSDHWVMAGRAFNVRALALNTEGVPQSGVPWRCAPLSALHAPSANSWRGLLQRAKREQNPRFRSAVPRNQRCAGGPVMHPTNQQARRL